MGEVVSLVIGILGITGLIFTALRWRRDDTTAVVGQQQVLFDEMRTLTDEMRVERNDLRVALEECLARGP